MFNIFVRQPFVDSSANLRERRLQGTRLTPNQIAGGPPLQECILDAKREKEGVMALNRDYGPRTLTQPSLNQSAICLILKKAEGTTVVDAIGLV